MMMGAPANNRKTIDKKKTKGNTALILSCQKGHEHHYVREVGWMLNLPRLWGWDCDPENPVFSLPLDPTNPWNSNFQPTPQP